MNKKAENKISREQIIAKALELVNDLHFHEFSGHDNEHVLRVWAMAKKIADSEPQADHFIVELAALLHDVDDYKLKLGLGDGENARRFMRSIGVDEETQEKVLLIIGSISFSKGGFNPQLPNLEAKVVYDADKLEALGAIGVARAFAYGGNKQRKLFEPNRFPEDFDLANYKQRSILGGNHTVNHLFEKSLKLPTVMQTKLGRELAKRRQAAMHHFLEEFFVEQNLGQWQELLTEYSEE
jgi:uncharacterized protein